MTPFSCGHGVITAYYSFIDPERMKGWSWPSWLTYSGRFTHINRHPSAVDRARRTAKNVAGQGQRSTAEPRNQPEVTRVGPMCRTLRLLWATCATCTSNLEKRSRDVAVYEAGVERHVTGFSRLLEAIAANWSERFVQNARTVQSRFRTLPM